MIDAIGNKRFILYSCALAVLFQACASRKDAHPTQTSELEKSGQSTDPNMPASPKPRAGESEILEKAARTPVAPFAGEGWQSLSDAKTLTGWKETQFAGHGEVECRSNMVVLHVGDPFTGISITNPFPQTNYEIALDAMRVSGSDFFCALTFPVGDSFCSLIAGGWGGSLFGLSSIDGMDASENETTKYVNFDQGKWYRIRVRVTANRIEGWLDKEKLIDVNTKRRHVSLRAGEIEMSVPLGICTWQTTGALREVQMRKVAGPADPPRKEW